MLTRRIREMVRQFPENGMKFLLENPLNVRELLGLLGAAWPGLIDWPHVTLDRTTYVQRDYRHVESDVVLRAPLRPEGGRGRQRRLLIYLLIEHQSEPDRWMRLRVLDYVVQIYKAQLRGLQRRRASAAARLQLVLPVVFYTGASPWLDLAKFTELIELVNDAPERVPALTPLFLNLNTTAAAQLETGGGALGWVLRLVQEQHAESTRFAELLERTVIHLESLPAGERQRWLELLSYLHALVYHGREPGEHADLQERIVESVQTDPRRKEVFRMGKTIAQSLIAKGRKEGRRKGREEGRIEGALANQQKLILMVLQERFGTVPLAMEQTIQGMTDVRALDDLMRRSVSVDALNDLAFPEV